MATSKKKYRRKQRKSFPVIPVAIGLFLVGFAVLMLVSPKAQGGAGVQNSVVPMEVNFSAPDLALKNITGEAESLADYRGQVVLVNNWATWCPPCKAEMPTLVAYHNKHAAQGFSVIAIEAGDPLDEVLQFASTYKMNFPVWLDPDGEALKAFRNGTLPNSYVIDRTGTIRLAWTGEISMEMLEKYVTPLIEESN
jgi:peroxiredoxin